MPSRNVVKVDLPHAYYHVYARGNTRSDVFRDDQDSAVFLSLFKRYLSKTPQSDPDGVPYPHFTGKVELICYCLMQNHFHLLLYQYEAAAMSGLMRSMLTSYSRYFNKKYSHSGPLFESRYKASLVYNQRYLEHITRYIHLNPTNWREYAHSSLPFYLGARQAEWLHPEKAMEMFSDSANYVQFLESFEDDKQSLAVVAERLASIITP
jgi:putative transposase